MFTQLNSFDRWRDRTPRTMKPRASHRRLAEDEISKGWKPKRSGKVSVRLERPKNPGKLLEDRVWSLLYDMQFDQLSGPGGGKLLVDARNTEGPTSQLDVVGIDADIALAIECKSQETLGRRARLQEELGRLSELRERFAKAVNSSHYQTTHRRHVVLVFFCQNVDLSKNDRERAKQSNIIVFDSTDLDYYERLVAHVGPAAKYQFFADMLPGKSIAGLEIRVPCVRTRLGHATCYSFPISPEYLLKISYVSHRSKGKRSDINTYQRMLSRDRLRKIRQYISEDGIFPTNIVVNLDSRRLTFNRIKQESTRDEQRESGILGWLDIRPAYKSAWIIDGQHRLYAYSGHARARSSHLTVLAFEGLPPSKQAQLFIDINAKQKSVRQSLLQELFAELHWDADKPAVRVQAIVSKAIQVLDALAGSALYGRIQTADAVKSLVRCISLTSMFSAIEKSSFYIVKEKKGEVIEFGPLWAVENEATLDRTVTVIDGWLGRIRAACTDWWDLGAAEGGGLAMNDGVTACINVLGNVFEHLDARKNARLVRLDNEDLLALLAPFADAIGRYFANLTSDERRGFRDLRGVQGQVARTRRCQMAIKQRIADFDPPGLAEWQLRERQQTNLRAKEVIDALEQTLQRITLEELKREFGPDESEWWILGVPKKVRLEVAKREQDDDSRRGSKESYFELIDYRTIAIANWRIFEPVFALTKSGNKEKRTHWMVRVNELRNIVSHPSSGVSLSLEELAELDDYRRSLSAKASGKGQLNDVDSSVDEDLEGGTEGSS